MIADITIFKQKNAVFINNYVKLSTKTRFSLAITCVIGFYV